MQKILNNQKGSVSLFVLLSALFFLVVVTSVAVSFKNKEAQIDSQIKKIQQSYEKDAEQIYNEKINNISFSTEYGTIEVIWLQGNTNIVSESPNEPNMYEGFEKVAWRDNGEEYIPTQNSEWYNYSSITGKEDNTASKWANAKNTTDGSYFVWIPRFAYRITYWDNENRDNIVGFFDGRGMVDKNGNLITKTINSVDKQIILDSGINTVEQNGIQYIVHPAFDDNVDNGGWKSKISGIWVAKYEMSREDFDSATTLWKPTTESNGGGNTEITSLNNTTIRVVSKPNVTSWRSIKVGYCYTNSYNYDRTKESHLMKNSEWGAAAYLTHSQFGRNGHEISVNQCTGYITGAGRGIGTNAIYNSTYETPDSSQQYNGEIGKNSSSTGNIYGIYDLSGGAYEYVASFNKLGDSNFVAGEGYGLNMTGNVTVGSEYVSNEYITAFSNETNTHYGELLYNAGKVGDATIEEYKGSGEYNWNSDFSYFARFKHPFLIRGGSTDRNDNAGVFCSGVAEGKDYHYVSFRIVLTE